MKKMLLGTAAVAVLGFAGAANAQDYYNNELGLSLSPYAGVYGGYGWTYDDADLDGADYGIYAGISMNSLLDQTVNRFGLALNGRLEGHYGWSSQDGDGIDKENEYGVSFKPGLSLVDQYLPVVTEPYAILGYRRSEFEIGGSEEDFNGFELGLGTEVLAYDMATVRLEYTHVFYGEEGGFKPDEDNIRIGVGYSF